MLIPYGTMSDLPNLAIDSSLFQQFLLNAHNAQEEGDGEDDLKDELAGLEEALLSLAKDLTDEAEDEPVINDLDKNDSDWLASLDALPTTPANNDNVPIVSVSELEQENSSNQQPISLSIPPVPPPGVVPMTSQQAHPTMPPPATVVGIPSGPPPGTFPPPPMSSNMPFPGPPGAPPVFHASHPQKQQIPKSSKYMKQSDIRYVLQSLAKPMFASTTESSDYYYRCFTNKMATPQNNKQRKKGDDEKEIESFQDRVHNRAKEWAEQQNILGAVVKTDVTRPKSLLNTTTVTLSIHSSTDKSKALNPQYRIGLWHTRKSIDDGQYALLELIKIFPTLRFGASPETLATMNQKMKVLQKTFGASAVSGNVVIDDKRLNAVLTFAKGQQLLARSMELGILPHPTATALLPFLITSLLNQATKQKPSSIGQQSSLPSIRLLRAIHSLIQLRNPKISLEMLTECLQNVLNCDSLDDFMKNPNQAYLQVLHVLLVRGSEECSIVNDAGLISDWQDRETQFRTRIGG